MKKILVVVALVCSAVTMMGQEQYKRVVNWKYTAVNSAEYFIDFWKQIFEDEFTSAHQDYLIQKYPNGCPKQEITLVGEYIDDDDEVEIIPADDVIIDMVAKHYNHFQANQYPTPKYVGEIFALIYKYDYYKHISLYDLFVTNQLCLDLINRGDFVRFMQNLDKSYSYIDVDLLTHAITKQDEAICSVLDACIYISMGNAGFAPLPVIFDGYYEFTNAANQETFAVEDVIGKQLTINDLTYEITSTSTAKLISADKNITIAYIPSTVTYDGLIYSVNEIGLGAFGDCRSLTSVTIGNSVTSIGESAFSNCHSLTSVTVPSHTEIGTDAFPEHTEIIRK